MVSPALPPADEMLGQQGAIFKDVNSKLQLLAAHVQHAEETTISAAKEQRAKYEQSLAEYTAQNDKELRTNEHIKQEISDLRASNKAIRARTDTLISENNLLSQDLQLILSNITIAEEFATQAILTSNNASAAPELSILTELATQDSASRKSEEHAKKLTDLEVAAPKMALISTLQGRGANEDAEKMIESLVSQFDNLKNEQNATGATLAIKFNKEMEVLTEHRASIMAERTELNDTKTALLTISERLLAAEKHLQATHEVLVKRGASLRQFSLTLGNRPLPLEQGKPKMTSFPAQRSLPQEQGKPKNTSSPALRPIPLEQGKPKMTSFPAQRPSPLAEQRPPVSKTASKLLQTQKLSLRYS